MSELTHSFSRDDSRLAALADALGIPVDWFYVGQATSFATDALDLIRLYASITDAQGRRRVMSVVRREAERCEASRQHFP